MAKPLGYIYFNQGTHNDIDNELQADPFTQQRVVMPMAGEIVEVWANPRNNDVDVATTLNVVINESDIGVDVTVPVHTAGENLPGPMALDGRIFVNAGDSMKLGTNGECTIANTECEFTIALKARERWDRANFYLVGGENDAIHFPGQGNDIQRAVPVRSELYGAWMGLRGNALDASGVSFDIFLDGADTGIDLRYAGGQLQNTGAFSEMTGKVYCEPGQRLTLLTNGETGPVAEADFTYCFRRA